MSTEEKRAALLNKYPGWTKVNSMPERQVHATYMRLLNAKQL